jgi:hypothetical protein
VNIAPSARLVANFASKRLDGWLPQQTRRALTPARASGVAAFRRERGRRHWNRIHEHELFFRTRAPQRTAHGPTLAGTGPGANSKPSE